MADGPKSAAGPAAENVRAILELEGKARTDASPGERISGVISGAFGSFTFVIVQAAIMAAWMLWNGLAPETSRFDPFPFGLLTFIVSLEGVFVAIFVLMAQNRMARQSDDRDHLNLQVDLLAEQEMTLMLRMLRRISERLEIPPENDDAARAEKLTEETNVYELMQTIKEERPRETDDR